MSATSNAASTSLEGKHFYITGGGGGLGLALARAIVPIGASVSLVTKDLVRIAPVLEELKASRKHETQNVVAVSADLSRYDESQSAFDDAIKQHEGRVPDWLILCAGFAKPTDFLTMAPEQLSSGFNSIYLTHANTVHIASKAWVAAKQPGTALLVSNIISAQSYAGYSGVAPARYALKGLVDTLSSELEPHGIKILLHMVSGQFEGGFDQELGHKTELTRKLDQEHGYVKLDPKDTAAEIVRETLKA